MKPGSSNRCKSKHPTKNLRCNLHERHVHGLKGWHQAKSGKETIRWQ